MRTSLFIAALLLASGASAQKPDILRFEPSSGTTGTTVYIFGKNLGTTNKVRFGGIPATAFLVKNDTAVAAVVGVGASGVIQINTPAGEDTMGYFKFNEPVSPSADCNKIKAFTPIINELKTDLACFRDSVLKLRVTNGEFKSYRWSNGDTTPYTYIKSSATVSVTVGNAALGCFSKQTTVKFVRSALPIPELVFKDSTLGVAKPAPYYRWYFNAALVGDGPAIRATKIGVYRVEVSDNKLCWVSSKEFKVTVGTFVPTKDSLTIKIYPNPSSGKFNVAVILPTERTTKITITITDISGSVVYKSPAISFTGREISIPIELTKKGTYRVTVEANEKKASKVLIIH